MAAEIFRTVHGSYLYGLDISSSDYDVYVVYEDSPLGNPSKLKHQMGKEDIVSGNLSTFLNRAQSGSHQAVEALFSPKKVWGPGQEEKWGPLFSSFRISGKEVFAKYERTILKFCYGDFKRRRHAVRLGFALEELRTTGRTWPELSVEQIAVANSLALHLRDHRLAEELGVKK